MDYSQLLKIRKQGILTAAYRGAIENGNTVFNRDKKTRGFDNGVVQVFFQKGLYLSSARGGNVAVGGGTFTAPLDINGVPDLSGVSAANLQIYTRIANYIGALVEGTGGEQAALDNVTNLPITYTIRGNAGSSSARFTGNIADDHASTLSYVSLIPSLGDLVDVSISYS
jgi:hypothetical protein